MARYPLYVPEYRITINGEEMPATVRSTVTSVRYQDGQNAADQVTVGLANPELRWLQKHIRGLGFRPFPTAVNVGPFRAGSIVPEGTFDIDNKLDLYVGYAPDPPEKIFEGELTAAEVTFPNGGMPSMTLTAHDFLQRLTRGTAARGFGPLPDAFIAAILSLEDFLVPVIDPTIIAASSGITALNFLFGGSGEKQVKKQEGQTNYEFLSAIAKRYDADFWVEGDILYISRFIKEYTPRLTLTYGESLLDFSPRVTTVGQVVGVSMKFTLREIPLDFVVSVFWDFDRESLGVSIMPGVAAKGVPKQKNKPVFAIVDKPITSPGGLAESAPDIIRKLRENLNKRLTGTGSAIGDPRIRAGAIIGLDGLGPDFSGNYRVKSATHSIDGSGYKTSFEVFKEIIP
jgi:Bacteriophage probable baseplate hub protein